VHAIPNFERNMKVANRPVRDDMHTESGPDRARAKWAGALLRTIEEE
jgi:hypothetical protein